MSEWGWIVSLKLNIEFVVLEASVLLNNVAIVSTHNQIVCRSKFAIFFFFLTKKKEFLSFDLFITDLWKNKSNESPLMPFISFRTRNNFVPGYS